MCLRDIVPNLLSMSGAFKRDIIIMITAVVLPLLLYFCAKDIFEMHTEYYAGSVMISIAVVVLLYLFRLAYKFFKDRTDRRTDTIFAMIGPAVILSGMYWALLAFNYIKVPMLLGYWQNPVHKTHLEILEVGQQKHKGNFEGGKITAVYEGKKHVFYSSRTLYFALKDRKSMDADVGVSLDRRNVFITKVYLDATVIAAAESAYWSDWWLRKRILFIIIGIFAAAVILVIALDRLGIVNIEAKMGKAVPPKKPGPKAILFRLLLFFMLTSLGLMLYLFFKVLTNK